MRLTTVSVMPITIEGRASGSNTFFMICQVVEPMTIAASRMYRSTDFKLVPTNLATKGAAAIVKGTIEAVVPRLVPMSHRGDPRHPRNVENLHLLTPFLCGISLNLIILLM